MKTKIKKTAVVLMSLIMVMCYMPMLAFAETEGSTSGNVAKIGTTEYDALANAITAAKSGETVELIADVSISETVTIEKDLTLDLGGKKITSTLEKWAVEAKGAHTVLVKNGTISGGKFGITTRNGANLTLEDLAVATNDRAVQNDQGTLNIHSGSYTTSSEICTVYNESAMNISGGTFTTTHNVDNGSVIKNNKVTASMEISGGTVTNDYGYGVSAYNGASVTISGNTSITAKAAALDGNNTEATENFNVTSGTLKSTNGPAIFFPSEGTLNISGGTIEGKTGIHALMGTIRITGGTITGTAENNDIEDKYLASGSGSRYDGSALLLVKNKYNKCESSSKLDVSISNGILKGGTKTISILSGTTYNQDFNLSVTGGTFTVDNKKYDVSSYFPNSYYSQDDTGKVNYYVPTPTPTPDNVTNNAGDKTTTADVDTTTTTDGKAEATVDKTTADQIVDKAVENKSDAVVIDATTTKSDSTSSEVKLPAETVKDIVEKTDADVVIKTDTAEVVLDKKAAEAVADKAATGTVSIVVEKVKEDENQVQIELKIVTEKGNVTDFKGGNAKVTIKLPESLKDKDVVCVYIDENGNYVKMKGKKNDDGTYDFTTGHFSTYAVMTAEEADKAIAEQEAAKNAKIKAGVKATTLKIKTSRGKGWISLKWTKSKGFKVDGYEVYRAAKKAKAFKKYDRTKKTTYKNAKYLKKGTRYYYKVRGYRIVGGEKVYTKWTKTIYRIAK